MHLSRSLMSDPRSQSVGIIGAGQAGLITAHTLMEDGFSNILILTRDAAVGGVWSPRRVYPGLQINKLGPSSEPPIAANMFTTVSTASSVFPLCLWLPIPMHKRLEEDSQA